MYDRKIDMVILLKFVRHCLIQTGDNICMHSYHSLNMNIKRIATIHTRSLALPSSSPKREAEKGTDDEEDRTEAEVQKV